MICIAARLRRSLNEIATAESIAGERISKLGKTYAHDVIDTLFSSRLEDD